jgi:hypothetical protein
MVAGSMLSCQGAMMFHKIIKAEVWLADMKFKANIRWLGRRPFSIAC